MTRRASASVAIASLLLLGGGVAYALASGRNQPKSHTPKFSPAEVAAIALHTARVEGDAQPTDILYVSSTHQRAIRVISHGEVPEVGEPNLPVLVIAMHGKFTLYTAHTRGGLPRGRWLTIAVESKTREIRDFSLRNTRPQLGRLGSVRHIATH